MDAEVTRIYSEMHKQVVIALKAKVQQMDRKMGPILHLQEWQINYMVLYTHIKEKGHVLSSVWEGPVRRVNKANPTMCHWIFDKEKERCQNGFTHHS